MAARQTPEILLVKSPGRVRDEWNQVQSFVPARVSLQHNKNRWSSIHLIPGGNVRPLTADAELRDVLAVQRLSQVAELHGIGLLCLFVRVGGRVDREHLVVAERVDGLLGKEAGMMHGAVVDDLHQGIVLVGDGCVVNVDQAVRAPREQDIRPSRVVLKLDGD